MGKKTRSARGEQVDFDLLRIKEQIASSPPPMDVKKRQDFIEKRLRRRLKKVPAPAPKVESKEDNENQDIKDVKLAGTETLSEEPKMIDEVKPEEEDTQKPTTRRRQRNRPPAAKKETDTE